MTHYDPYRPKSSMRAESPKPAARKSTSAKKTSAKPKPVRKTAAKKKDDG